MSIETHPKSGQFESSTVPSSNSNDSKNSNPLNFYFTHLDTEDLAAKVAEILFPKLEQRFKKLEAYVRKLDRKLSSQEQVLQKQEQRYLRPKEVEQRYSISRDLLSDLVDAGYIKRYDAGAHGRYRTDELEGYLRRYHVNGLRKQRRQ